MQISHAWKLTLVGGIASVALGSAHTVNASGFALMEQNVSGLGNAYAGSAAVAEDASTIFFNSAGLTQLDKPSLVVSANVLDVSSKFRDGGSLPALAQPLGGNGGNAGGTSVLPALYFSVPLSPTIVGGIGVNSPFGLKTEYDTDWMGRFQAIKSDVKTVNFNTALAFKLSNVVSLGVGIDYQTINAELTNAVNYSAVVAQGVAQQLLPALQNGIITQQQYLAQIQAATAANAGLSGLSSVKGNDSAWGYDIGLLFTPTEHTKIGVSYRSAMSYRVAGNATFAAPTSTDATGQAVINAASNSTTTAAAPTNGPVSLAVKLPASARLAIAQDVGSSLQLLGEVSWTQWSSIPELRIQRTSGVVGTLKNTPENWENSWRYALGANFQVTPAIKLRVGAAVDKSPVLDGSRTPRLPDNKRTWYAAGAKFAVMQNASIDVGYARVNAKDAPISQNDGNTNAYGLLSGTQETSINIFGLQGTLTF